jgi:hypothetical protein
VFVESRVIVGVLGVKPSLMKTRKEIKIEASRKSNLFSNYFALESNKSQPQTMTKAIIEEKILFH